MQEDELDLEDSSPQKRAPLRGRRSTPHQSPRTFAGPGSPSSGVYSGNERDTPPQAPPRSKKTGGWASDLLNMGFHRKTKTQTLSPPKENTRKDQEYDRDRDDSENDIPVIPDLEELKDEELVGQVAQAPAAHVNRVATLQELDNDLLKHAAFSTLDGLDLRILTRFLAPESETKEEDVPWTWDVLFTEVSSALNEEWEGKMDREIELPEFY